MYNNSTPTAIDNAIKKNFTSYLKQELTSDINLIILSIFAFETTNFISDYKIF